MRLTTVCGVLCWGDKKMNVFSLPALYFLILGGLGIIEQLGKCGMFFPLGSFLKTPSKHRYVSKRRRLLQRICFL